MQSETLQFIAQTKLRELQEQRSLLVSAYDTLQQEMRSLPPVEKLRAVYEGLQKIKCARKPLHPEVVNLELLFSETGPSAEVLQLWQSRLEKELSRGRMRAEIVYLFGALLGEWEKQPEERVRFQQERKAAERTILGDLLSPLESESQAAFPAPADAFGQDRARIQSIFQAKWSELCGSNDGAHYFLSNLQHNIYQPAALRMEAKRLAENAVLQAELTTAIGLSARQPAEWDWPQEGVPFQVLWTRNKWRLYLRQPLPAIGILESYGDLFGILFRQVFSDVPAWLNRKARLAKLLDLNAPEVIVVNERRMLRDIESKARFTWYEPSDPWDSAPTDQIPEKSSGGIVALRATKQAELRDSGAAGYYAGGYGGTSPQLQLANAEVQTLRAAYPESPLFVLKLDIQDYYSSIPHGVLIQMLRSLGYPEEAVEFCQRFLAVPLQTESGIARARRGVPMDQGLSKFLAETLLLLMEQQVHRRAKVRILRVIDDICLLSPSAAELEKGYAAIQEFLQQCGLRLNSEKTGALAIGGKLPPSIPAGAVRWGMLELRADASWGVHEPTFQAHWQQTRERLETTHSILERVSLFNANLRFLTSSLGVDLDLGDEHRQSINAAILRFHAEFFGPSSSIVEGIRRTITERYLGRSQLGTLPESWLYWPITAGGLSLQNPLVVAGQLNEAFSEARKKRVSAPTERKTDWQFSTSWFDFYNQFFEKIEPKGPKETRVMKTLVDDFIQRGSEISAGSQKTLSDYWRWILALYGPEILEQFGTFRFLITDLVPLQLIHERLLKDSSLQD